MRIAVGLLFAMVSACATLVIFSAPDVGGELGRQMRFYAAGLGFVVGFPMGYFFASLPFWNTTQQLGPSEQAVTANPPPPQIVGSKCVVCQETIILISDGRQCSSCYAVYHVACDDGGCPSCSGSLGPGSLGTNGPER